MGCGQSQEKTPGLLANGTRLTDYVYDRRPKIDVTVSSKAEKLDTRPRIVFIFGECSIASVVPFLVQQSFQDSKRLIANLSSGLRLWYIIRRSVHGHCHAGEGRREDQMQRAGRVGPTW